MVARSSGGLLRSGARLGPGPEAVVLLDHLGGDGAAWTKKARPMTHTGYSSVILLIPKAQPPPQSWTEAFISTWSTNMRIRQMESPLFFLSSRTRPARARTTRGDQRISPLCDEKRTSVKYAGQARNSC